MRKQKDRECSFCRVGSIYDEISQCWLREAITDLSVDVSGSITTVVSEALPGQLFINYVGAVAGNSFRITSETR